MIKCTYYSRLLKLSFSILLISCFGLLGNYSNASLQWYVDSVWGITSQFDSGYLMSVSYKWVVNTSYLWDSKQLLMYSEWNYFFWDTDWKPYISFKNWNSNWQGYPSDFLLCDPITNTSINNCTRYNYSTDNSVVAWVVSRTDTVYYWKFVQSNEVWEYYQGSLFCFSNWAYNKSVCFYSCTHPNCGSSTTDTIWGATLQRNLSNSKNLSLKLSEISSSNLWNPPWYIPWIVVGPDDITINQGITWDYSYTTCTYKELIDYFEYYWYGKQLCYWWIDNFDLYNSNTDYNPVPWTWKTLMQIANYSNTWDTPVEWFNFWNWLYWNDNYNAMWESYPAVFHTWFDMYYMYHWNDFPFDSLYNYCNIKRMSELDWYSDTYKWNSETLIKACRIIKLNPDYSSSWQVNLWVNWNWVWDMGNNTETNPVESIQNFFNDIKATINTDYTWIWFLPWYIVLFLCALILFRFISH